MWTLFPTLWNNCAVRELCSNVAIWLTFQHTEHAQPASWSDNAESQLKRNWESPEIFVGELPHLSKYVSLFPSVEYLFSTTEFQKLLRGLKGSSECLFPKYLPLPNHNHYVSTLSSH